MKKIHLLCDKDSTCSLGYIKFTSDKTYACNSHSGAIIDTSEVLPDILTEGEDKYVLAADWANAKAYSAVRFAREGNQVICFDKKNLRTTFELRGEEYTYPKFRDAFPTSFDGEINSIGINHKILSNLCEAVGATRGVKLTFNAFNRAVKVDFISDCAYGETAYMAGIEAIIMPIIAQ